MKKSIRMIGDSVVADSSVIIDLMKGDTDVATKFQSFTSVFITPTILSELLFGAYRSAQPAKNIAKIRLATSRCRMLTIDEKTAERFVDIKLSLQAKGNPIPENDIWIAASALQYELFVYTKDAHFKSVDGLQMI